MLSGDEIYRLGEGLNLWEGKEKQRFTSGGRKVSQSLGIIPGQEKLRDAESVTRVGAFGGPPARRQVPTEPGLLRA